MTPFEICIAFGNKLQAIREADPTWKSFDPEVDREFQVLMASAQQCFEIFEQAGFVLEPQDLTEPAESWTEIADEIKTTVKKYQ